MKKTMQSLALSCLLALMLGGCHEVGKTKKVPSTGALSEIFVVGSQAKWEGVIGDTLKAIFRTPYPVLNQYEPLFDLYHVTSYAGIINRSRNLLAYAVDPKYPQPQISAAYDVDAAPQIVVSMVGPSDSAVVRYVSEHRYELQAIFELAERTRMLEQWKKGSVTLLTNKIREKFNMHLPVPVGYTLGAESTDFIALVREHRLATQGFFIYSYPYTGREDFTMEALTARRDEFAARIISDAKDSHMITVTEYEPTLRHLRIDGRYWAELRGFWDMANDFMGGPFLSYSTVDLENQRMVTIDCYVYSPKNPKRNLMRQLENLVYAAELP